MDKYHLRHSIHDHVSRFFKGHQIDDFSWTAGPITSELPDFRVMQIGPGPKTHLCVYTSAGAFEVQHDGESMLEFLIIAPWQDPIHIELLAMITSYHLKYGLGLGHTVPIGRPWLKDSRCDHLLVSLPYPFGPELEVCKIHDAHVHLFWLLPITKAERDYKASKGQEALERKFDKKGIDYSDPKRKSAI